MKSIFDLKTIKESIEYFDVAARASASVEHQTWNAQVAAWLHELEKRQESDAEVEARAAAQRDALLEWKVLAHFLDVPEHNRESFSKAIVKGESALKDDAGKTLLEEHRVLYSSLAALQDAAQKVLDSSEYSVTGMTAGIRREPLEELREALKESTGAEILGEHREMWRALMNIARPAETHGTVTGQMLSLLQRIARGVLVKVKER